MSELELLRDVAWAAGAFIKADDEWKAQPWASQPDPQPTAEELRDTGRLADNLRARRANLKQALARLAEAHPELLPR